MKTNLQFFLNNYNDLCTTTTPSQNNFRWLREINGIGFDTSISQQIQLLPSITSPNLIPYTFSTPVASGNSTLDSTNIVLPEAPLPGISIGNLIVGGGIPVGTTVSSFVSTTIFTVTSANASVGATYTNNGQTFTVMSSLTAGVTLVTTGTGLPASSGTLTKVSGTGDSTITFSAYVGPSVTMSQAATTSGVSALSFYNPATFVYLESDQQVSVIYNNGSPVIMNPFEINGLTQPAVFFLAGAAYSLTVTNLSTSPANVFLASMG